jgi:vacuolar-type H+-ATPase subunit I/STV1
MSERVKSVSYTPGYIYLVAFILALPATWLVVGRSGEDVPGMIAMVVTVVFFGVFTIALGSLRRCLQNRRLPQQNSSDDPG